MNTCFSCQSNDGTKRINPGEQIYNGAYWVVEHAYPSGLLGWLVIVLKRHTEKLNDLSLDEWKEFAEINYNVIKVLHKFLETQKEYACCLAESEGFKHIHFHIIPKSRDFDQNLSGAKSFQYLKVTEEEAVEKGKIK